MGYLHMPAKPPVPATIYRNTLADAICERIAAGESLRQVCADKAMPAKTTVMRWLLDDTKEYLRDQYARARAVQLDGYADELVELADTPEVGEKVKTYADGTSEVQTGDMIERSRLKVDTRKWVLSKLLPKKYGDKVQVGGADDLPAINVNHALTVALDFDAVRAKRDGRAAP